MLSGILLGRFMGVSWESCLGGGESLLLMGCVTLVSSRSAWSGVINDWQQSALTGFISVPVLSLNASNLQRVLLGSNSIQRLTTRLCVPPSHITALTQTHSRLAKDTFFSLIDERVICTGVSEFAVSECNKRVFQGRNGSPMGRNKT